MDEKAITDTPLSATLQTACVGKTIRCAIDWKLENYRFLMGSSELNSNSLCFKDLGLAGYSESWSLKLIPFKHGTYVGIYLQLNGCRITIKTWFEITITDDQGKLIYTVVSPRFSWFGDTFHGTDCANVMPGSTTFLRNGALHLHADIEFQYGEHKETLRGLSLSTAPPDAHSLMRRAIQHFTKIFQNGTCADFKLISSDVKMFSVHRGILAARSPVFAAMLKNHTAESISGTATLIDVDGKTLEILLSFMYSADASRVGEKAEELLVVADKYDIADLREVAVHHLFDKVTVKNARRLLMLADQMSLSSLKQKVLEFGARNLAELISVAGVSADETSKEA